MRLGLFQESLLSNDLAADNLTKFLEDILNRRSELKFQTKFNKAYRKLLGCEILRDVFHEEVVELTLGQTRTARHDATLSCALE